MTFSPCRIKTVLRFLQMGLALRLGALASGSKGRDMGMSGSPTIFFSGAIPQLKLICTYTLVKKNNFLWYTLPRTFEIRHIVHFKRQQSPFLKDKCPLCH